MMAVRSGWRRRPDLAAWLAVGALWLAHMAATWVWLRIDTRPLFWDMAGHALGINTLYARLAAATNVSTTIGALLPAVDPGAPYPPLVYLVAVPFVHLFGLSRNALILVNGLFVGILLASTYGIASRLDSRRTGLWAAFIVSMYAGIYAVGRIYLLDVPLAALVALANYTLLRASDSDRLSEAALAGLAVGASLLVKHIALVFEVGGLGLFLWSLRARPPGRRWQAVGVAALAAGAIAIPWYLANLPALTTFWRSQSWFALMEQDPGWTTLKGWGFYLRMLPSTQLFVPLSLFFGLGLIIVILRWKDWANKRGAFLLAVWFCLPYIIFTVMPNKNMRYTLPLLPVAAIVTALGLGLIRSTAARRGAQIVLVGCALVQFVGLTVGLHDRFPQVVPKTLALTEGLRPVALYSEEADVVSAPRHEDWRHADILRDAVALAGPITGEPSPLIIVLPSVPGFDPGGFAVDIIAARLPVRAFGVPVAMDMEEATRLALSGDFIVSKDGWRGRAWWLGSTATLAEELTQPDTELGRAFELKREYALPDGSRALLYQRRPADGT